MRRALVVIAALCLAGCAFLRDLNIPAPRTPEEVRRICLESCEEFPDFASQNVCRLACPAATPAAATPTATVTNTATVAPTASPTSAPAIETAVPVGGICTGPENKYGPFKDDVEAAVRGWLDAHPPSNPPLPTDKWRFAGLGGVEYRLRDAATADEFVFAVVRTLRALGKYDVVAEATGGTPRVAMSPKGDAGFHAGYALVVGSSWDVRFPSRGSSYLGQCKPRGFELSGNPGELPAPTVAPTPVPALAKCPPLLTVTAAVKGGTGRWQGDEPGKWCLSIDMTGRFDVDGSGRGQPCNAEKFENCGAAGQVYPFAGDACEPAPDSLLVTYSSAQGPAGVFTGYSGRVCGPAGSPYTVKVTLTPDAKDKAGRPITRGRFAPFLLQGAI
jgi:hypothetical protein